MKSLLPLTLLFSLFFCEVTAQEEWNRGTKSLQAERVQNPPKIDGILNDEAWRNAPVARNFFMIDPGTSPERATHPTRVKFIYDDEAIYIGAYMKDNEPGRILREFTQRDIIGQSDFFLVDINTYNDGENHTRFVITSAGALADARMKGDSEDYSYNVVWQGEISFDEEGWYAEMKIPYSALRFPEKEMQLWSVQFARQIKHLNEVYTWNFVDKAVGKASHHQGLLTGIRDVNPPVRLSLYPYASAEADYFEGKTRSNLSAGMDIKYGISDAFTLDATLVPDFGQTAFDDVELNLSPFEQQFNENRAFFTEGTELFNKGGLFYSRRIGDTPTGFGNVQQQLLEDEVIVDNPEQAKLFNALKISGRTDSDLGIGFFNAITQKTVALLRDERNSYTREVVTEPFTNYNILVLDQQFNRNSSITLINTNVTREGNFRDGNVSGFLFDVFNRSNSFRFNGEAKMSNVNLISGNITGFATEFSVNRTKGNIRYYAGHSFANETYDINDLGLNFYNNYNNFSSGVSYQIFEPVRNFNELRVDLSVIHERRYKPDVETLSGAGLSFMASTRNRFYYGGGVDWLSESKDFFEPRVEGRFITYNENFGGNFWVSSDYRKKFAYDVRAGYQDYFDVNQHFWELSISPRYRFSNRITAIYELNFEQTNNRKSFVALSGKDIIFGNRDMQSIENKLTTTYNFNTRQAVDLSFRNFWSAARFYDEEFYRLQKNGNLEEETYTYSEANDPNANFNIWNLDLSYRWRFAPGSEAILLYRNSIFNLDDQSKITYSESLEKLFQEPTRHNLSLRIVYFLDYNSVKNVFKG